MAEIVFRLPSKVPYGYVEVRFGTESHPAPEILAGMYANYVMAFAESERAALSAYRKPSGAPSDVSQQTPGAALVDFQRATREVKETPEASPVDAQAATQQAVDEANEIAKQIIESELGSTTTVGESSQAPWEKPAPVAQPKPWEKSSSSTAPSSADNDFF